MALVRGVIILGSGWLMSRTRGVVIAELNARFHPRYAPLPPAGPPVLTARTGVAEATVELSWTNGTGEPARTKLYRSAAGLDDYTEIADLPLSTRSYIDTPPETGEEYDYRAAHYNVTDFSEYAYATTASQVDLPDGPPINLVATVLPRPDGETQIELTWTNGDATAYTDVFYRQGSSGPFQSVRRSPGVDSYMFTGQPDTLYEFHLKHYKNGFHSDASNTRTARTLVDGPNAPPTNPQATQPQATVEGERKINLSWVNGDSTAETLLYVSTNGTDFSLLTSRPTGVTSHVHDTGAYNARRWYRFQHRKNGVYSDYTSIVNAYSGIDVPNAAPSGLQATTQGVPQGETTVQVTWVNGDASCVTEIFRRLVGTSEWGTAVHTAAAGATSWLDNTRSPSQSYEYKAEHVKNGVRSASSNVDGATTLPDGPNAPPYDCEMEHTGGGNVTLSWKNGDPTASVQVYRNGAFYTNRPAGSTSYSMVLSPGSTTRIKVRHHKNGVYSAFSNEAVLTVPTVPEAPTLSSVVGGAGRFTLNWSNADPTASVEVYMDGALYSTRPPGSTSVSFTGFGQGVTRAWKLRAVRDGFASGFSAEKSATTDDPVDGAPVPGTPDPTFNSATLNWTNTDPTAHTTVYGREKGETSWTWLAQVNPGVTSYTWYSLYPGHTYEYMFRHVKTDQNGNTTDAYSGTREFTTDTLQPPTNLFASHLGSGDNNRGGDFSVSWTNRYSVAAIRVEIWNAAMTTRYKALYLDPKTTSATLDANCPAGGSYVIRARHEYWGEVSPWVTLNVSTPSGPMGSTTITAQSLETYVSFTWTVTTEPEYSKYRLYRNGALLFDWVNAVYPQDDNDLVWYHDSIGGTYKFEVYRYRNGYRTPIVSESVYVGPPNPVGVGLGDLSYCEVF